MAPPKRKRDDMDESDSDEPLLGKQILPVADLPDDFDGDPLDGMQYLFTVRRNARLLPHVTRVDNPYALPEQSQPHAPIPITQDSCPGLPSDEWRELYQYRFKNFRKNANQPTISVGANVTSPNQRSMPDKKERDLWWAFLAGKPESDWNPHKKPKKQNQYQARRAQQGAQSMRSWADDPNEGPSREPLRQDVSFIDEHEVEQVLTIGPAESLPTPMGTPVLSELAKNMSDPASSLAVVESVLQPREPSTGLLRLIDERMALHLLMYFSHWINHYVQQPASSSFVPMESHARWMFALFTRIDDFISADDMSLLRNLARAVAALLQTRIKNRLGIQPLNDQHGGMSERSCWIILSTVVEIWKQRDLWTDTAAMVGGIGIGQ